MKKIVAIILSAVIILGLYGCSNSAGGNSEATIEEKESIDGYEYGYFETFNSYAEDNGFKNTQIYIKGTVKSVFDFADSCLLSVQSEDNGRWVISFVGAEYSEKADSLFDEKEITCFGRYGGYSDVFLMPIIYIDKVEVDSEEYDMTDIAGLATSETVATTTTAAPEAEATTAQETTETYTELFKNADICLYYVSTEKYKYEDDVAMVNFIVENKTDNLLEITSGLTVLDGITYNDSVMADEVAANSKANIHAQVEGIFNFDPSTVGLKFTYKEPHSSVDDWKEIMVDETKVK